MRYGHWVGERLLTSLRPQAACMRSTFSSSLAAACTAWLRTPPAAGAIVYLLESGSRLLLVDSKVPGDLKLEQAVCAAGMPVTGPSRHEP